MVIKKELFYPPKNSSRILHIYLPENYYNTEEKYPVMYFFDGHNLFYNEDATFGKSWGLKEFLDQYDKKMIIVGMECTHEGQQRLGEYSPYKAAKGMFSKHEPLGDETIKWILNDIKPMIDKNFRTWSHREATGIGGSSMGGLMSIYALVKYNKYFSKGACISSAIGFCLPDLIKDMNKNFIHPDTRAFLSWGTMEAHGIKNPNEDDKSSYTYYCNNTVSNKFLEYNALPKLYCQIGGRHCEEDWEKLNSLYMDYLWK